MTKIDTNRLLAVADVMQASLLIDKTTKLPLPRSSAHYVKFGDIELPIPIELLVSGRNETVLFSVFKVLGDFHMLILTSLLDGSMLLVAFDASKLPLPLADILADTAFTSSPQNAMEAVGPGVVKRAFRTQFGPWKNANHVKNLDVGRSKHDR